MELANPTSRSLESLAPFRRKPPRLDLARLDGGGSVPRRARGPGGILAALGGSIPARPLPAPPRDPFLALLQRTTYGADPGAVERARAIGQRAYLEEQLDPSALDDADLEARLARMPTLAMSPKELADVFLDDPGTPYFQLKGSVLLRAVYSRRQLHARLCEFWRDHFHVDHDKGDIVWLLAPEFERTVILPHALGTFPELLRAAAFSPAMQFYLDNWLNVAGAPQENYARELMELHTLGVDGGYGERDVREVARCLTGWTLITDFGSRDFLRTTFHGAAHAPGAKSVLGHVIPASPGRENALRVLDILAAHPSTAGFLARKLTRWFLGSEPRALVARVARTYLDTGGDVRAMLRVILAPENLARGSLVPQPKFRRPFHFLASLLRLLEADVREPLFPLLFLASMGHLPLSRVQPDGYPDTVAAWGGSMLPRWKVASWLVGREVPRSSEVVPGVHVHGASLRARLGRDPAQGTAGLARSINERLLAGALSSAEERRLQRFVDESPEPAHVAGFFEVLALALSMPGFQWY